MRLETFIAVLSQGHATAASRMLATRSSLGVGRGFAVLVGVFALMLALTILGGHLRASWRRERENKRR